MSNDPTDDLVSRYANGEISTAFWRGLAEGQLLIPHCRACDTPFFFPRRWCPHCWSDQVEFVVSPGEGEVFAISELHTAFQGITKEELPVSIAIVELDEGVRIPGRMASGSGGAAVGDRVVLRFAADPPRQLPLFEAVARS